MSSVAYHQGRWRLFGTVLAVALTLALPTLLNGVPFLYTDTATYLAQGQQAWVTLVPSLAASDPAPMPQAAEFAAAVSGGAKGALPAVVSGRSIYYGLVAYAAYAVGGGWPLVAVQALAVAWPLVLLVRAASPASWPMIAVGASAFLAFLTPLGLFTGLLMPDIWVGAMILALASLVAVGPKLGWAARMGLLAIPAYAVTSHNSHLLLLLVLLLVAGIARLLAATLRNDLPTWLLGGVAACAAAGFAAQAMFGLVIERAYGQPPISRPFLTAHLIELGPGQAYVEAACGEDGTAPGLTICRFADRLPMRWIPFLFEEDPEVGVFEASPDDVRRALAEEQSSFVLGTLRHDPLGTTVGLAREGIAQLWHLSVRDVAATTRRAGGNLGIYPDDLAAATRTSFVYRHPDLLTGLTRTTQVVSLLASFGLVLVLTVLRLPRRHLVVLSLLLAGVVLNGLLCGALASPYGRFQARVAWILPLAFVLLLSVRPYSSRLPLLPVSFKEPAL